MFIKWLCILFLCYCAGDLLGFYERSKFFQLLFSTVFAACMLYCLVQIRRGGKAALPDRDNIHRLACLLFSLIIFAGGFMAADGQIKTQKSWQGLTGKQLILQGAVEPESIRRKEQGVSALFAAEWPLHGKRRAEQRLSFNVAFCAKSKRPSNTALQLCLRTFSILIKITCRRKNNCDKIN